MGAYIDAALATPVSGIECRHWIDFFKVFTDATDPEQVEENIRRLLDREATGSDEARAEKVVEHLRAMQSVLSGEPQPRGRGGCSRTSPATPTSKANCPLRGPRTVG